MRNIDYLDAYKCFLQFVNLVESENTSYKIEFMNAENKLSSLEAKFKIKENGHYELSFSTKLPIHPQIFKESITIIKSEWYNIVFDSIDVYQVTPTFYNSEKLNEYRISTKSFRTSIEEIGEDAYMCAFYKYDHNIFNPDNSCVLGIGHNPIKLKIGDCELTILWGEKTTAKGSYGDERYLVFFSNTKMNLSSFKEVVNAVRVAWGLISGYYIGKSVYYLSCKPELGCEGINFEYNNMLEEIVTYRGMLDYRIYDSIPECETHLTIIEFERFVNMLYDNESFFRAALLLIYASKDEDLQKGGIAAIALETITGALSKERKEQKGNDNNEFKMPNELFKGIQDIIIRFKEKNEITDKQQEHYLKRLNDFSKPFNSEKLTVPFAYLNITLSETEKKIIDNRNSFLHGYLPKKNQGLKFGGKLDSNELIFYVSNTMYYVVTEKGEYRKINQ